MLTPEVVGEREDRRDARREPVGADAAQARCRGAGGRSRPAPGGGLQGPARGLARHGEEHRPVGGLPHQPLQACGLGPHPGPTLDKSGFARTLRGSNDAERAPIVQPGLGHRPFKPKTRVQIPLGVHPFSAARSRLGPERSP